jgi:hypothetical protein
MEQKTEKFFIHIIKAFGFGQWTFHMIFLHITQYVCCCKLTSLTDISSHSTVPLNEFLVLYGMITIKIGTVCASSVISH